MRGNRFGFLTCLMLVGTFVADLLLPLGYAMGVPYLFAVMASRYWKGSRTIVATTIVACLLVLPAFWLVSSGNSPQSAMNRLFGMAWIVTCGVICVRQERAAEKLRQEIAERKRGEVSLREGEEQFRSLVEASADVLLCLLPDHRILYFNREAERVYGCSRQEVLGKNYLELFLPSEVREAVAADIAKVLRGQPTYSFENQISSFEGRESVLLWNVNRLVDAQGRPSAIIATGHDITARKQAEDTQAQLLAQLQQALQEIKVLRGLLPICMYCKKIRDDTGFWQQLEVYLRDHTEAEFSHGICPHCLEEHYSEFMRSVPQ